MQDDLFGQPAEPEPPPKERSLRDQEKDGQIAWKKYTGRSTPCGECVTARQDNPTRGIVNATQTRHEGFDVDYYCGYHAAERKLEEELEAINSKRRPKEAPKVQRPFNPHTHYRRNRRRF